LDNLDACSEAAVRQPGIGWRFLFRSMAPRNLDRGAMHPMSRIAIGTDQQE
jgi:hypothetical protein